MTTPIDELTAWTLLRKVRSGWEGVTPQRVHHDPDPEAWLQVHPSGDWNLSATPTVAARDLLDLYLPIQLTTELTIGQIGQSLDGRFATATGHSHFVTGPEDICRLHRVRALVDAVVVGANTVELDDPQLTVRRVDGENPARVVLDPRGRVSRDRNIFTDGAARTIHLRGKGPGSGASAANGAVAAGQDPCETDTWWIPVDGSRRFEPSSVLSTLRKGGFRRILIEGGAITISSFLRSRCLDRLHVTVAPILIGSGRHALELDPIERLDEALRPRVREFRLGEDTLFDLELDAV